MESRYRYRTKHGPHIPRSKVTSSSEPAVRVHAHNGAYPVSHFGPQHGLTPAQVWEAEWLLRRADLREPIDTRSYRGQLRWRLRLAGIVSAVKHGRAQNSGWGRRMLAKRGGLAMKYHGPHILAGNREKIRLRRQAQQQVQAEAAMVAKLWPSQQLAWQRNQEARRPRHRPNTLLGW